MLHCSHKGKTDVQRTNVNLEGWCLYRYKSEEDFKTTQAFVTVHFHHSLPYSSLVSQARHFFPGWWVWPEVRQGKRVWCLWAIFHGMCRNVGRSNEILAVTWLHQKYLISWRLWVRVESSWYVCKQSYARKDDYYQYWTNRSSHLCSLKQLDFKELRKHQELALHHFINDNDFFVSPPTGSGKSLCYWMFQAAFNALRDRADSISTPWLHFYHVTLPIIAFHVVKNMSPRHQTLFPHCTSSHGKKCLACETNCSPAPALHPCVVQLAVLHSKCQTNVQHPFLKRQIIWMVPNNGS